MQAANRRVDLEKWTARRAAGELLESVRKKRAEKASPGLAGSPGDDCFLQSRALRGPDA